MLIHIILLITEAKIARLHIVVSLQWHLELIFVFLKHYRWDLNDIILLVADLNVDLHSSIATSSSGSTLIA